MKFLFITFSFRVQVESCHLSLHIGIENKITCLINNTNIYIINQLTLNADDSAHTVQIESKHEFVIEIISLKYMFSTKWSGKAGCENAFIKVTANNKRPVLIECQSEKHTHAHPG